MPINIVLLQCGQRSGHFGQGVFVNTLLPHFLNNPLYCVTSVYTDERSVFVPVLKTIDTISTLLIPPLIGQQLLTGEQQPAQQYNATLIAGILYEKLMVLENPIFWVNSIDFLNVCTECKLLFPRLNIFYVHHSFSWKYMLNISDKAFAGYWKDRREDIHPKAFEMTQYQKQMALLADRLVVVTEHAKLFFSETLEIPANKIIRIYNGIDFQEDSAESKHLIRQKYGFDKMDKILIFCGRITRDKGIGYALKAFTLLAEKYINLKFVVMGAGYISDFVHFAEPYWNRVTFTGELSKQKVYEFYSMADIGVIPSLHEQCSFSAIEMRFHGLPIVVAGIDGLDELFVHDFDALKIKCFLNKQGEKEIDPSEFAGLVSKLIDDEDFANTLANNSKNKAFNMFSLKTMQEEYGKMIQDLYG